ncbi:GntR family transcriptional regulator [Profundibacterium mesophilum]|uniref:Undecaprenyl-diphosphatase n=1 Tax=Profundibacterium mesophilum KAUST100406-0324 TaxID=1037889 RepID=A0A921NX84_9RHOB|nr:GntR family transcriptional regulator [Profundibacterium mesophilum]KAF0677021.1 undecaprenyl-diphosphatase [Profundibacterium mesophilum KAUST100406-0324]
MRLAPLSEDTRREMIVRSVRDLIVSGAVAPGARLTETQLAAQLGVSRGPLREAIRDLVESGLVVSLPYKGLFVRAFTRRDLEELYSFRTTLEKMAFCECWHRRDTAACAELVARHEALSRAAEEERGAEVIELELALHSWCYELADHRLLSNAWQRLRPNLHFYFALHHRLGPGASLRREIHETYLACALGDDLDAMLTHVEAHMRQGLERTLGTVSPAEADGAKAGRAGPGSATTQETKGR